MLAPHVNPRATEYGVVLRGEGVVQVVFPNGSLAMSATVRAGDVFWVPRYFPFCQAASRGAPLEFFGFTTSVLRTMLGPELAAGLGTSQEDLRESVILPPFPEKHEEHGKKGRREREPPVIEQVA
jgi:hypothetical protein